MVKKRIWTATPIASRSHGPYVAEWCIYEQMANGEEQIVASSWGPHARQRATLLVAVPDMVEALHAAQRLITEALPKFNWGASALDADAIRILNETPGVIAAALKKAGVTRG